MDFKVRRTYGVKNTHFCTQAATPTDTFYNIERLKRTDIAGIKDAADSIAFAIKFHYEALRDKEDGGI